MKKVLLLAVSVMMVSSVAMADHIGLYSDEAGSSCSIAPGFYFSGIGSGQPGLYIVHKFAVGTTGSRFGLDLAGAAGGTSMIAFSSPYTYTGPVTPIMDLSVGYGAGCKVGSVVVGTLTANVTGGMLVLRGGGAVGDPTITDCNYAVQESTGGFFYVGGSGDCHEVATEPTTWGQVKALYR